MNNLLAMLDNELDMIAKIQKEYIEMYEALKNTTIHEPSVNELSAILIKNDKIRRRIVKLLAARDGSNEALKIQLEKKMKE